MGPCAELQDSDAYHRLRRGVGGVKSLHKVPRIRPALGPGLRIAAAGICLLACSAAPPNSA